MIHNDRSAKNLQELAPANRPKQPRPRRKCKEADEDSDSETNDSRLVSVSLIDLKREEADAGDENSKADYQQAVCQWTIRHLMMMISQLG
jgi:hypothetical protein